MEENLWGELHLVNIASSQKIFHSSVLLAPHLSKYLVCWVIVMVMMMMVTLMVMMIMMMVMIVMMIMMMRVTTMMVTII